MYFYGKACLQESAAFPMKRQEGTAMLAGEDSAYSIANIDL
jgi:hypothetical protein